MKSLAEMLGKDKFFIDKDKATAIARALDISIDQLLVELIPLTKENALPPISKYYVSVAALGESGNIYLGVNIEIPGAPLNATVHAEQFAIAHARQRGETKIITMAFSAAPCGHCRQFLNELGHDIRFLLPCTTTTLSALLPEAFGPHDLKIDAALLHPTTADPMPETGNALQNHAMRAAQLSYAPYSHVKAGVAIQIKNGTIYVGNHIENAAFNPSLSPLHDALIALISNGHQYADIEAVVLVEPQDDHVSFAATSRMILDRIAPEASFVVVHGTTPSAPLRAKL